MRKKRRRHSSPGTMWRSCPWALWCAQRACTRNPERTKKTVTGSLPSCARVTAHACHRTSGPGPGPALSAWYTTTASAAAPRRESRLRSRLIGGGAEAKGAGGDGDTTVYVHIYLISIQSGESDPGL